MAANSHDVIVAGGGPAGSLAALLLARTGRRVLLAGGAARPERSPDVPEVLSPRGVHHLERLGLGDLLDLPELAPCPGILSFWDADRPDFTALEPVQLRPGWTLDRRAFDRALRERARAAGVEVRVPARLRFARPASALSPANGVQMVLESLDGEPDLAVSAPFLIEATGRGAGVDPHSRKSYADRLVALAFTIRRASAGDGFLRLTPTRSGWWYWIDRPGSAQTVVFLTDGDLLPRSPGALGPFLEAERASDAHLPSGPLPFAESSGRGGTTPAIRDSRTGIRRAWNQPRRFPIGDAAYTLDPLSGSGLVRALRRASTLADVFRGGTAPEPDDLRQLALSAINEFQTGRLAGAPFYDQAAARFPDSAFWTRRVHDSRRKESVMTRTVAAPTGQERLVSSLR